MKGHIVSSFFLMGIFAACTTTVKQTTEPVDYAAMVNPFIGTDFTGNTYPGAQAPFGMVQLSPDNGLGGWNRWMEPDFRILLSGQYDCQLQSYTSFWNWRRRFI